MRQFLLHSINLYSKQYNEYNQYSTVMAYTVYSVLGCRFCDEVCDVLELHDIPFVKVMVERTTFWKTVAERTNNHRTYPLIFRGEEFCGGHQEFMEIFTFS